MTDTDAMMGRFSITARLFKLVSDMSKDQQLLLLKQLMGDKVSTYLYKLIVEMTEEQQIILSEQLAQLPKTDLPVKMLNLEETESSMRESSRKPCLINASYRIQDRDFKSYILDVSVGGVFIEAKERFPKGMDLLLEFSIPNRPQPFAFSGKIAWSGPRGFGVKFDNVTAVQGDILKSFIEQNE